MGELRRDGLLQLIVGIAALGTALILLREINYGVGVEWDGAGYIVRARAIAADPVSGLRYIAANQPPLFPMALALAGLAGADIIAAAGYVNAAAFGLTILAAGLWLRARLASRALAVWGTAAVMASAPLAAVAACALTEPTFCLFTLLGLICAERFLRGGRWRMLLLAAALAAAACMTRYMGVALPAVVAALLLFQHGAAPMEKARRVVVYSFIALGPLCAFLARNLAQKGTLVGARDGEGTSLLSAADRGLQTMMDWALPVSSLPPSMQGAAYALAGAAACAGICAAGWALIRRHGASGEPWAPGTLAAAAGFAAVYLILLGALAALTGPYSDSNFTRFFIPLYAPLAIAAAVAADRLLAERFSGGLLAGDAWARATGYWRRRALAGAWGLAAAAGLFVSLAYPAAVSARGAWVHITEGMGYTSAKWAESDVIKYMKTRQVSGPVYTNMPEPVAFLTGARTVSVNTYEGFKSIGERAPGYVAYFPDRKPEAVFAENEIPPCFDLALAGADGDIYRCGVGGVGDLGAAIERAGAPMIRSNYDVRLDGDRLIYTKGADVRDAAGAHFFLHITPADADDGLGGGEERGFENWDFGSEDCVSRVGDACAMAVRLPGYAVSGVKTGQYIPGKGKIWEGRADVAAR